MTDVVRELSHMSISSGSTIASFMPAERDKEEHPEQKQKGRGKPAPFLVCSYRALALRQNVASWTSFRSGITSAVPLRVTISAAARFAWANACAIGNPRSNEAST